MATASTSSAYEKEVLLDNDYISRVPAIPPSQRGFAGSTLSGLRSFLSPVLSPINAATARFDAWRDSLDLPNPGSVDKLDLEARSVQATNLMFDGARADLSKSFNLNPAFQVAHSFVLGQSQPSPMGGPATAGGPGQYSFMALYATNRLFLQGNIDHEGALNTRCNIGWSSSDRTKFTFGLQPAGSAGGNMIQIEHDRVGKDYGLTLKAYNPGLTDGTGVYLAQYLQSVTKRLAIGTEYVYQSQAPDEQITASSYMAKYVGGAQNDWIGTATLGAQGALKASYWQRLSDKVEAGAEYTVMLHPQPAERKATAVLAAKYDFRLATIRAQLDNAGKVSAHVEQRFTPAFSFLVAGEIDHWKNTSKFGIGLQIETPAMEESEMQRQSELSRLIPPV